MKLITSLTCLLATLAMSACGDPADETHLQEQVIGGFYQQHLKTPHAGLPSAEEVLTLQPFVSQNLLTALNKAAETEARYHAAAQEPKPPLVDGDLFTSLFEGASSWSVDHCESEEQRATCLVQFSHQSESGSNEHWQDKLVLIKENQQWHIDDIEFLGSGQSSQREYLSDTLGSIIKQYN